MIASKPCEKGATRYALTDSAGEELVVEAGRSKFGGGATTIELPFRAASQHRELASRDAGDIGS